MSRKRNSQQGGKQEPEKKTRRTSRTQRSAQRSAKGGTGTSSQEEGKPKRRKSAKASQEPKGAQMPKEETNVCPEHAHGEEEEKPSSGGLRPVEIVGIEMQGPVGEPMVVLKEVGGRRVIPIWIGQLEAQALYIGWRKIPTPRPLTPDLLLMVVGVLGGKIERVILTTVALNTYFAVIEIRDAQGRLHRIDARPSDAMALAVRTGAPLLASEETLARGGIVLSESEEKGGETSEPSTEQ